jgi:hypothetical protein
VNKLFAEFIRLFQSNFEFISKQAQTLNGSYYSLPLMFNVINTLKTNKVGLFPHIENVQENEVIQSFADILSEGPEKSFSDIAAAVKESIQTNNETKVNLEKVNKVLDNSFQVHQKWSKTVDIEKIPPTRPVEIDDNKETELSHKTLEMTAKIFEKSRVNFRNC